MKWLLFLTGNVIFSVALGTLYGEPYGFLVFGGFLMLLATVTATADYFKSKKTKNN
jgi:hypothetical protein